MWTWSSKWRKRATIRSFTLPGPMVRSLCHSPFFFFFPSRKSRISSCGCHWGGSDLQRNQQQHTQLVLPSVHAHLLHRAVPFFPPHATRRDAFTHMHAPPLLIARCLPHSGCLHHLSSCPPPSPVPTNDRNNRLPPRRPNLGHGAGS